MRFRPPSSAGVAAVMRSSRLTIGTFALLMVLAFLSLLVGPEIISPMALLHWAPSQETTIIVVSRFPRTLALIFAGSSMAVAGLIMQMLARNRFVEPGTSGTIESATFGLLLTALLAPGLAPFLKMIVATAVALGGTLVFLAILQRAPRHSPLMIPLIGLMLGGVINAASAFIAYRFNMLQSLAAWSSGDFTMVLRGRFELLWASFAALLLAYLVADRFTVAGLGRDFANNLGLNYRATLAIGLSIVAVVTATVVATVGALPFVGLAIPNVVSLALGDNVRRAVPLTALTGAAFLLFCDIVGRVLIRPYEIPVGPIVGVIGGIVVLALLKRGQTRFGR